jgi:hypothetical protein
MTNEEIRQQLIESQSKLVTQLADMPGDNKLFSDALNLNLEHLEDGLFDKEGLLEFIKTNWKFDASAT